MCSYAVCCQSIQLTLGPRFRIEEPANSLFSHDLSAQTSLVRKLKLGDSLLEVVNVLYALRSASPQSSGTSGRVNMVFFPGMPELGWHAG